MKNIEQLLNKENWIKYLELANEGGITNHGIAQDIVSKIQQAINHTPSCTQWNKLTELKNKKMSQLKLSNKELLEIGFKECKSEADEMNPSKTYFKIDTLNGYFYYNPKEDIYTWYHRTVIGEFTNDVNLDINVKSELFVLLSCYKADFNYTTC